MRVRSGLSGRSWRMMQPNGCSPQRGEKRIDIESIRADFPILRERIGGRTLIYLDNAATSQLPRPVIDTLVHHLEHENANIHRGSHALGRIATDAYEDARATVARFLGAPEDSACIFTSGTTHGVNMVANGLIHALGPSDAVLTTGLEHHSDYLPWQRLAKRSGAELRVCGLDEHGDIDFARFRELLADGRVRIAAVTACSNVSGAVTDLPPLIEAAHEAGALILADAAQCCRNTRLDVACLGCDYLVLSGHKMCAPTGIGVLYGTRPALERLEPQSFGGGMVKKIHADDCEVHDLPTRLEAGTPNIAGAVALAEACRYMQGIGLDAINARELALTARIEQGLTAIPGVAALASPRARCGAVSFTHESLSGYRIAARMDELGIAVRSGHHCAIPALEALGSEPTVRISPAFYNTEAECDAAVGAAAQAIAELVD